MKLIRLEICNIRQYFKEEILFPPSGVIGITGPNGSGKSTIANVIQWILYPKYENLNNEDIRNCAVSKKAPVLAVLDFEFDSHFYRIMRSLSSSDNKNYIEKDKLRVASGTKNINEYIEQTLFKMDCKAFKACFYAAQGDFDALAKMNNAPRVQLISNLLQLNSIDIASEEDRKERKAIDFECKVLKSEINNEINFELEVRNSSEKLRKVTKSYELESKRLFEIKNSISKVSEKITKYELLQNSLFELTNKKEMLSEKIIFFKHNLLKVNSELESLDESKKTLIKLSPKVEQYNHLIDLKDELSKFREKLSNRNTISNQIIQVESGLTGLISNQNSIENSLMDLKGKYVEEKELRNPLIELQLQLATLENKATENRVAFLTAKNELSNIEKTIANISSLDITISCPTCHQPLTTEHKQVELELQMNKHASSLSKLRDSETLSKRYIEETNIKKGQILDLQNLINENSMIINQITLLEEEIKRSEGHISNTRKHLEQLNSHLNEFDIPESFTLETYNEVLKELELLNPTLKTFSELNLKISNEPNLLLSKEDILIKITEIEEEDESITKKLRELKFDEHEFKSLKNSLLEYNVEKDHLTDSVNKVGYEIALESKNHEELKVLHEKNKIQLSLIEEKENLLLNYDKLDLLYKGYKGDKFAKLAPELSKIISKLLTVATDGLFNRVILDDTTYAINVYNGNTLMDFNSFSGAQKKIIAICQRIAISQLLASITQAKIKMILFDEAFGSLDIQNQDNVVELFRRLYKVFPQILIIAHNDYLKEQFDHTLQIDVTTKELSRVSTTKWLLDYDSENSFNEDVIREILKTNFN